MAQKEECTTCHKPIAKSQMGAHLASKTHLAKAAASAPAAVQSREPEQTLSASSVANRDEAPELNEESDDFDPDAAEVQRGETGDDALARQRGKTSLGADRHLREEKENIRDSPPPFADGTAKPFNPNELAGAYVDPNKPRQRPNARDMGDGAQAWDEIDVIIGAPPNARETDVVFEWCRDLRGFRLKFSRYYHTRGVLIDRFARVNDAVRQEVGEKVRAIQTFNKEQTDKTRRLGYIPMLLGTPLTPEQADLALARHIVETVVEYRRVDGTDEPDGKRIVDMSAQVL